MAIHFYRSFSENQKSRNFGDDINAILLPKFFNNEIIESRDICIVGIGTILNDRNGLEVSQFKRKVVFSSGAGYGDVKNKFDDSWDFVCVRGPKTANLLGISPDKAICDGAILLAEDHAALPASRREGIVFIPHVSSHWSSGRGLQKVCRDLSIGYIAPDAEFDAFIDTIRRASFVVTEAMHGAIVADSMRTPWVPVNFLHHNAFKWQDWCESIQVPYRVHDLGIRFWDAKNDTLKITANLKQAVRWAKTGFFRRRLAEIINEATPVLSEDSLIVEKQRKLRECVTIINERYG